MLNYLAKSNLIIAACAGLLVSGAYSAFELPVHYPLVGFVFFATLFTYNFQRRVGDLNEDRRFSDTESLMMGAGLAGMILFSFGLQWKQLTLLLPMGVLSILYAFPVVPVDGAKKSLRQLPYAKLWIIVLVWTVTSSWIPLMDAVVPEQLSLYILQQGFFITALTIPFDIRDLEEDGPEQRTLPQMIGVRKSRWIALLSLTLSAVFGSVLLTVAGEYVLPLVFHLGVCAVSSFLIFRSSRSDLFYTLGIDGMLLLQGLLFTLS
jgi:hypothetical protein